MLVTSASKVSGIVLKWDATGHPLDTGVGCAGNKVEEAKDAVKDAVLPSLPSADEAKSAVQDKAADVKDSVKEAATSTNPFSFFGGAHASL